MRPPFIPIVNHSMDSSWATYYFDVNDHPMVIDEDFIESELFSFKLRKWSFFQFQLDFIYDSVRGCWGLNYVCLNIVDFVD